MAHRSHALIPILALVELAWLAWFLYVPLPNVQNLGHAVSRWIFNDEVRTRIVKHTLGDSAGVIGAALLP